ncbi:hypothetical protein, partial [Staphylococcus epidermidis]|uniref:hypothetical protein n=1 Tax=Staphylococcus epidermidis TaxID=1282 RepID=UPI001C92EBE6
IEDSSVPSKMQKLPVVDTPTAILNQIIPPPSLTKHSPSTILIQPFPKTLPFLIPSTPTPSLPQTIPAIAKPPP